MYISPPFTFLILPYREISIPLHPYSSNVKPQKKGATMPLFYNKVQRVNPRDPKGV